MSRFWIYESWRSSSWKVVLSSKVLLCRNTFLSWRWLWSCFAAGTEGNVFFSSLDLEGSIAVRALFHFMVVQLRLYWVQILGLWLFWSLFAFHGFLKLFFLSFKFLIIFYRIWFVKFRLLLVFDEGVIPVFNSYVLNHDYRVLGKMNRLFPFSLFWLINLKTVEPIFSGVVVRRFRPYHFLPLGHLLGLWLFLRPLGFLLLGCHSHLEWSISFATFQMNS